MDSLSVILWVTSGGKGNSQNLSSYGTRELWEIIRIYEGGYSKRRLPFERIDPPAEVKLAWTIDF